MKDIILSVENVSKQYFIGASLRESQGLRHTLEDGIRRLFRRSDPSLSQSSETEFWALSNLSFEIAKGDVVGIIGRNGAGKSTLLKILSRITQPTSGKVRIRGRVASLLEVGTGFHPELTGRENIFLNGTILGMSHKEIRGKFDAIVAFSEIEKFIDTPVKRYSSGMYVRLAFAVAAHLEPEILVIDEVLAVGDAQFQKKCLGKMESVSKEGRTVLFVSHSMPTISSLCTRCILLEEGKILIDGEVSKAILRYYYHEEDSCAITRYPGKPRAQGGVNSDADSIVGLLSLAIESRDGRVNSSVEIDAECQLRLRYRVFESVDYVLAPNLHFFRADGSCAFVSFCSGVTPLPVGDYEAICLIPKDLLNEGVYFVGVSISSFHQGVITHLWQPNSITFNVRDPIEGISTRGGYPGTMPGALRPALDWSHTKI